MPIPIMFLMPWQLKDFQNKMVGIQALLQICLLEYLIRPTADTFFYTSYKEVDFILVGCNSLEHACTPSWVLTFPLHVNKSSFSSDLYPGFILEFNLALETIIWTQVLQNTCKLWKVFTPCKDNIKAKQLRRMCGRECGWSAMLKI